MGASKVASAFVLLACGAGGGSREMAMSSGEDMGRSCAFRGPYQLSISLVEGSAELVYEDDRSSPLAFGSQAPVQGCDHGASGAAVLQTTDTEHCTVAACVDDRCATLSCVPGSPVTECTSTDAYDRAFSCGCSEPTSWRLNPSTHMLDPNATCPSECIKSMRCEYSWRLEAQD